MADERADLDVAALEEPEEVAAAAGLAYVTDDQPGIRRQRRGRGFTYLRPDGSRVAIGSDERAWIESLAVPPAWTDVWIAPRPDAHILATGRDDAGRKQYRYHPRWRAIRDAMKYEHLAEFGLALPDLRRQVAADLRQRRLSRERVVAAVVRLLDQTLIRVGNEEYAADNETFGATTLRPEHVRQRSTIAELAFPSKGGEERLVVVRDRPVLRVIEECLDRGGRDVFHYERDGGLVDVSSDDVNAYLRRVAGDDVTAKMFRTWGGTVVAGERLGPAEPGADERELDRQVLAALDDAAERLGNTRAVCRSCYVAPHVPAAHRSGALRELWQASRQTDDVSRAERMVTKALDELSLVVEPGRDDAGAGVGGRAA